MSQRYTRSEAIAIARQYGFNVYYNTNYQEWRVVLRSRDTEYFTPDLDDAVDTGIAMVEEDKRRRKEGSTSKLAKLERKKAAEKAAKIREEIKRIDIRNSYVECAKVRDIHTKGSGFVRGTLYLKGTVVQVWWEDGLVETWRLDNILKAVDEFYRRKDEWG